MSDSSKGEASDRGRAPGRDDADAVTKRLARGRDPLFLGIAAICDTATRLTGVDGAALAVLTTVRGIRELVHATDAVAQQLDELQFVLGEGPCLDAYQRVEPQMCAHIDDDEFQQRWPAFTAELATLGVLAVFAYPVPGEPRPMGVLELYRHTSGPLGEPEHQSAQLCAAALRTTLAKNWREHLQRSTSEDAALDAIAEQAGSDTTADAFTRFQVHVAAGMVAVQLGITTGDALDRLRAYAYAQNRSLLTLAADVVARRLSFSGLNGDEELDS
ncbi:GAF domain-containing protein [Mycolicibacterium gadium]|uniref:GAF domain-containing protein n=1 Tax=Mycolicibacterium gadium TaxID=1794 RepID=A0A7I7WIG9_MYCGU|nr:GAF domain-containing protein [Mycolicibacterium gadium]BBZ16311.1 GAF domain-containing protein [Mycolicibacterium gadium]